MCQESTNISPYYWEEEEMDIPNPLNPDRSGDIPLVFALPFLLVFLGILVKIVRLKFIKNRKNQR
jgi:hypothetical protein